MKPTPKQLANLKQPREAKVKAGKIRQEKRKAGISPDYTQKIKQQYLSSPDLMKSLKLALKRHAILLQKAVELKEDGEYRGLPDKEVREFNALSTFLGKFLEKALPTQTENKNEHKFISPPTVFMPTPKDLPRN